VADLGVAPGGLDIGVEPFLDLDGQRLDAGGELGFFLVVVFGGQPGLEGVVVFFPLLDIVGG